MEALQPEVNELYLQSGNLPMPPDDVKDYNEVCHGIFASVDNLYLAFSDLGRGKWDTAQRDGMLTVTIKGYLKDKGKLRYEEEKMH